MLKTLRDLKRDDPLREKMLAVRAEYTSEGKAFCTQPILGPDGKPYRLEPKPGAKRDESSYRKRGLYTERCDGVLCVRVPLGTHGIDYLAINAKTGEIVCAACEVKKNARTTL